MKSLLIVLVGVVVAVEAVNFRGFGNKQLVFMPPEVTCEQNGAPCVTSSDCCDANLCYKEADGTFDASDGFGFCDSPDVGVGSTNDGSKCSSSRNCQQGSCCQSVFSRRRGILHECHPNRKTANCIA